MLKWLGPRTLARAATRFAQYELDARLFARSAAIVVKALEGGRRLTRPQLYALFERAKIATKNNRGVHILFRHAHDGLICFAAREGRQPTLALLEIAPRASRAAPRPARRVHAVLLPPYDEYTVAYKDRGAALDPKDAAATRNGIFSPTIVIDGRIAGLWTRRVTASGVEIALQPLGRLTPAESRAIAGAAARYGRFLGRSVGAL